MNWRYRLSPPCQNCGADTRVRSSIEIRPGQQLRSLYCSRTTCGHRFIETVPRAWIRTVPESELNRLARSRRVAYALRCASAPLSKRSLSNETGLNHRYVTEALEDLIGRSLALAIASGKRLKYRHARPYASATSHKCDAS